MKRLVMALVLLLALTTTADAGFFDFFKSKSKAQQVDEKAMYSLSSSLTKLSAAVESTVRYKNPPKGISDSELLTLATKHDPKLLEPFKDYKVRVSRKDKHALVLVCDKKGKQGLLEDAGCSGAMDKHLWQSSSSCKFTLNLDEICKKK